MINSLKTIVRGAQFMFFGLILSKFLNYIYRAILARSLTTEQYGMFALGQTTLAMAIVFGVFGFNQAVERFIGYYSGKYKQIMVLKISWLFVIPISLFFGLLLFIFSNFIALHVFGNPGVGVVLKIVAFALPLFVFFEVGVYSFKGWKNIEKFILLKNIIEPSVRILATLILLYYSFELIGAILAYVVSGLVAVLFVLYYLREKIFTKIKLSKKMFEELFSFSWPLLLTGIFYTIITSTDTFMLGYYLEESSVGVYNIAVITSSLILLPQTMFEGLITPVLSRLYKKNNFIDIKLIYKQVTKFISFLALPVFVFLIIYGREFISFLFGDKYSGAYLSLIILCAGYFVSFVSGPNGQLFNIFGDTKAKFILRMFVFILNVILNIVLIPHYGILGAAVSTSLAIILANIINVIWIYWKREVEPFNLVFLLALICVFISSIITKLFLFANINNFYMLFFAAVVFSLIYFILLYLFGALRKEDIYRFIDFRK